TLPRGGDADRIHELRAAIRTVTAIRCTNSAGWTASKEQRSAFAQTNGTGRAVGILFAGRAKRRHRTGAANPRIRAAASARVAWALARRPNRGIAQTMLDAAATVRARAAPILAGAGLFARARARSAEGTEQHARSSTGRRHSTPKQPKRQEFRSREALPDPRHAGSVPENGDCQRASG